MSYIRFIIYINLGVCGVRFRKSNNLNVLHLRIHDLNFRFQLFMKSL